MAFFSVIIPTLNEEKGLPLLLNSLACQTKKNFEVIIVDAFSTDQTAKIAKKFIRNLPSLLFIEAKTKNVSAARNLGAKNSKGEFLVFFDADVEIEKDFFAQIEEKIVTKNLDLTTVWNRAKAKSGFSGKIMLSLLNSGMTLLQKLEPLANGPCIIIRRTLFQKIDGFNENIIFGEDYQLIKEAKKQSPIFAVYSNPKLYVSTRRFDKEGLFLSLYKSTYALIYQTFMGPITHPIFDYKMGGNNFKE